MPLDSKNGGEVSTVLLSLFLTPDWFLQGSPQCESTSEEDWQRVYKYIEKRAMEFSEFINAGTGEDDDPIRLGTLGFQFDQAG